MNPYRRWLHKFSRIPDSKRNESERFFVFGREFSGDLRLGKPFCGIWAFLIVIVRHSFSFSCHFRFWQGKPGDPRVKPGDDIRGGVNQGMIPGELSGTSLNMTDKRKPEYDGKDGERDKSEKLIFFLKNQLICYRFADSSKNRPAPFGACGHVLTI